VQVLDDLVELLALERIEADLFRGQSQDLGWGTVFGGQVLGQALSAAVQTVPKDRHAHSLHAYFLRPGDVTRPIVYDVDRIRDGGTFTTRRVVAIQNGHAIFNLAASFQIEEEGFEHQDEMPEVPAPETLATEQELFRELQDRIPPVLRDRAFAARPFEVRPVGGGDLISPPVQPARRMVWLKTVGKLPDDPALHRYLLAYASDHAFVTTALLPHGVTWHTKGMQVASLDHVMWFHRAVRVDEWLLHVMRGRVFTRDGKLVATTAQEGLIRKR
jgi:acyl-CoA thioesterase-2